MREEIDRLVWIYLEREKYPVAPHMTFTSYHGRETPESSFRRFKYEIQLRQWQIINREYYRALKYFYRHYINTNKIYSCLRVEFARTLSLHIKYGNIPNGLIAVFMGLYK